MRCSLPAWLCCLSLFSLEILSLALPLPAQTPRHRLRFPRIPRLLESSPSPLPTVSNPSVAPDHNIAPGETWRALLHKGPPPGWSNPLPDQKPHTAGKGLPWRRASRGRRHAQLMRVGCVLGTCQVQNLSHRLYQLIGQSGREDSSPINPRSPHSYG